MLRSIRYGSHLTVGHACLLDRVTQVANKLTAEYRKEPPVPSKSDEDRKEPLVPSKSDEENSGTSPKDRDLCPSCGNPQTPRPQSV